MQNKARGVAVLATVTALFAGCGDGEADQIVRAPRDAIPQSVLVDAADVVEGLALGKQRSTRHLESFRVGERLVSVAQYRQCVDAGFCTPPSANTGFCAATPAARAPLDGPTYTSGLDHVPVTCTAMKQAARYCEWVGARLPTPAQWQLAARGTKVRRFAWGDSPPDCSRHWRRAFSSGAGACCHAECAPFGASDPVRVGGASPPGVQEVLATHGELVRGDPKAIWPTCRQSARGCVVKGTLPGAIDVFVPAEALTLPAGFRCVWREPK